MKVPKKVFVKKKRTVVQFLPLQVLLLFYHTMYSLCKEVSSVTHNLVANLVEISLFRSQLTELQTTLRDREATIQEITTQNEGLETKVGRLSHAH